MATNGNEWQSLVPLAEWQADILLFLSLSSRRLRMPLYAIKGASPDVIQCHKTKVFRFNPATQAFPLSRSIRKQKFSALILLRRLFLLLARNSLQAASLHCFVRRFRFIAPNEKLKVFRFPLSVFRFLLSLQKRKG